MTAMRWGIVGTGRIARTFVAGAASSSEELVVAVASRDKARADAMAAEFGLSRAYGSYEELILDPDIDAIYIGLPNSLHAEWSIAGSRAAKHVLCEKPLAVSASQAEAMFAAAREGDVWLMEAFMYRFHPRTLEIEELIRQEAVGEVRLVRASFGFSVDDPGDIRLAPELGAGALMDVGCYCVNFARFVLGSPPASATASARLGPTGVDEMLAGTLEYDGGALAQVSCGFSTSHHNTAQVIGSDGIIEVENAFTPPRTQQSRLLVRRGARDATSEVLEFPPVDQYRLEAEGFSRLVRAGHGSHGLPEMPLVETLDNMATIEALLRSARSGRSEPIVR
jgi:D-xylose 1-dehydrogenase (NADP+, D-xylono-1,5-lactone-forming)